VTQSIPTHVDLLISFTNSVDHDEGTDDLMTPGELSQWLFAHGLLARGLEATDADLGRARRLRDALHEAMVGNHDGAARLGALQDVAVELPLLLTAASERPGLRPMYDGISGALTQILVAVNSAVADDTWRRLKICSSAECAWAFFDGTKNRSRTYCEWGCGNKIKTRNYRARQRALA
jgi:predicted RNA-binding Zn ribbon-like protein